MISIAAEPSSPADVVKEPTAVDSLKDDKNWEVICPAEDMLGAELSNLSSSARLTLGYAMRRASQILLSLADRDTCKAEGYEPFVVGTQSSGLAVAMQDSMLPGADAAKALSIAAGRATEAVATMREAERELMALRAASAEASTEAEASLTRLNASQSREALLDTQLAEVEHEVDALQAEHDALVKMVERRRAAHEADRRAVAEVAAQVSAERREAERVLSESIEQLTTARAEVQRLRGDVEALAGDATAAGVALAQSRREALDLARQRASVAQSSLASLQAEEAAKENARQARMRANDVSHQRNSQLAAIDTEATQASVDALIYRLDGKYAQAAVLGQQLAHMRALTRVEAPAAAVSSSEVARLNTQLQQAESEFASHREHAARCMRAAQAAATASLAAMDEATSAVGGGGSGETVISEEADVSSTATGGEALAAGEVEVNEAASGDPSDLAARLASAAAEASRWRKVAEDLHDLQDTVIVELNGNKGGGVDRRGTSRLVYRGGDEGAVGNASLAARWQRLLAHGPLPPDAAQKLVNTLSG
eukprot:CAMPEP_0174732828 /NCGR_PEP_ID=MMETSP1094-20130205/60098_1 /TAXON_ID=156173 /ORGANISM="Chrysochromulina brevifilum, Strain UTEX LB 985" /LENGTH=541 /DNA_ID=CAMNT_0015935381 /DNA_START=71 /DNA_END=1693 /DNA_ORIENTATION=-